MTQLARLLMLAALGCALAGCWPKVPEGWEAGSGEAITRVRAVEGDAFIKLKGGLARTLYDELDAEQRCVQDPHCKRRGAQLVCSTENGRDPYVCELHVVDGALVAPRGDWELYHSLESNRRYGTARLDGAEVVIEGDAADALNDHLGTSGAVRVVLDPRTGAATL